jgi:hypothetical protein
MERMWFPLTELLLLTGLRWGEGAAYPEPGAAVTAVLSGTFDQLPELPAAAVSDAAP